MAIDLLLRSEKAADSPITVEEHDQNLTDIQTLVNQNESDISSLGSRLDTAEGDIDNLESDMGTAQGDIGNLETAVGYNTSHRGVVSGNPHSVSRADLSLSNIINGTTGVDISGNSSLTGDLDITGDLDVVGDITVTEDSYLTLPNGAAINEFSTDDTMAGDSDAAVPTEKAVKAHVTARLGDVMSADGTLVDNSDDVVPTEKAVKTYVDAAAAPKGKNVIINGGFRVQQRGTSFGTGTLFTADRWKKESNGDTTSAALYSFAYGLLPDEPQNFLGVGVTYSAGAGNYTTLIQKVEDVRTLADSAFTLSFYAVADSGTPQIAVEVEQIFGSGGSDRVQATVEKVTLANTWTKYTINGTLASISGKTLGSGHCLALNFWLSAGSTFDSRTDTLGQQSLAGVYFAQVQLEKGSVATEFEKKTYAEELAACQRYFFKTFRQTDAPGDGAYTWVDVGVAFASTAVVVNVPLPVTMRTHLGTVTMYGSSGEWQYYLGGGYSAFSGHSAPLVRDSMVGLTLTGTGFTAGNAYLCKGDITVDAEL